MKVTENSYLFMTCENFQEGIDADAFNYGQAGGATLAEITRDTVAAYQDTADDPDAPTAVFVALEDLPDDPEKTYMTIAEYAQKVFDAQNRKEEWTYAVKSTDDIRNHGLCGWYAILLNGVDELMGKTAEDYIADGYQILSDKAFHALVRSAGLIGEWKEITETEYEDALNVLPPEKWYNGGFFSSEHWSGDISAYYQEFGGKYYTSMQSVRSPRAEIMTGLMRFVEGR